jgi:hypothetical protein
MSSADGRPRVDDQSITVVEVGDPGVLLDEALPDARRFVLSPEMQTAWDAVAAFSTNPPAREEDMYAAFIKLLQVCSAESASPRVRPSRLACAPAGVSRVNSRGADG